jgi:hypothetical protein
VTGVQFRRPIAGQQSLLTTRPLDDGAELADLTRALQGRDACSAHEDIYTTTRPPRRPHHQQLVMVAGVSPIWRARSVRKTGGNREGSAHGITGLGCEGALPDHVPSLAAPARAPVSHGSWSCRGPLPHNRGVTDKVVNRRTAGASHVSRVHRDLLWRGRHLKLHGAVGSPTGPARLQSCIVPAWPGLACLNTGRYHVLIDQWRGKDGRASPEPIHNPESEPRIN